MKNKNRNNTLQPFYKIVFVFFVFITISTNSLFSQFLPNPENPNILVCETNPITGKMDICHCEPAAGKDALGVIYVAGGAMDNDYSRSIMLEYINSACADVSIPNGGLHRVVDTSLVALNILADSLYRNHNVGYLEFVGGEFGENFLGHWNNTDISFVGKNGTDDLGCKEIAVSYILGSYYDTKEQQKVFLEQLLQRFIIYHKNESGVLDSFANEKLQIGWDDSHTMCGIELNINALNEPSIVFLRNTQFDEVRRELTHHPAYVQLSVHANTDIIGMGLTEPEDVNNYGANCDSIYTKRSGFTNFSSQIGTPFLILDMFACQVVLTYGDQNSCCWPQTLLAAGEWAHYSISGGGNRVIRSQVNIFHEPFLGKAIRTMPSGSFTTFGDITAHLPKSFTDLKDVKTYGNFEIYPDPAKNILNINITDLKKFSKFELLGIAGNVIFEKPLNNNSNLIDISELVNGIFLVRLSGNDGNTLTRKFIKL